MKLKVVIIFSLLLSSCSLLNLQKVNNDVKFKTVLSDTTKTYIYRANLSLYDKDFSGMIILKPKEKNNRIVFINEIGMKFFDLEFTAKNYKVNQIFEPMNKKMFIKLLINDFRFILMNNLNNSNIYYKDKKDGFNVINAKNEKVLYYFKNENLYPKKAIKYSLFRATTFLTYSNYVNEIPKEIKLKHKNLKFSMDLSFVK